MKKDFRPWFKLKPLINNRDKNILFNEREVWWCSIGTNVGFETDGKNSLVERPVLVYKKYNKNQFFGFPITSIYKKGKYYSSLKVKEKNIQVLLSQGRVFDSRRLIRRLSKITNLEFKKVRKDWYESLL
jgi:hypothetical protein